MTQKEVDIFFALAIEIHINDWFGKREKPKDREIAMEWVTKQLAKNLEVYTIPVGSSWGVIVDKETYDNYWKDNSKVNFN